MDESALKEKFEFNTLKILSRDLSWYRIAAPFLSHLPPSAGWRAASRIGSFWASRYFSVNTVIANLSEKSFSVHPVLEKLYAQWAVSSVVNCSFLKWDRHFLDEHIQITGHKELEPPSKNGPVFYFSAHNFFMFAIISMLGVYGHSVYPLVLNSNLTVPPHLIFMFNRVVNESASLMNGGSYIFTGLDGKFNFTGLDGKFNRSMLDALRGNSTFFAAVDFPKDNFVGEWQRVSFLDGIIEIPSKLFKFTLKNKIPSFFVHMRWDNATNKLMLDIEKLSIETAGSVSGACALFASALEKRVSVYPESWEGWKWAGVFK